MLSKPMDVLTAFPVRKTKKQKQAFRNALHSYCQQLGYAVKEEKGSCGAVNLVFGDPDRAKFLVTAHYDTCAGMPFPNLITPCNFFVFLAYQLLLVAMIFGAAIVMGVLAGVVLQSPEIAGILAYICVWVLLGLMMFGPANKHNANDNTSGVVTVLEMARTLPQERKDDVCFVLFDLEEAGLVGSASYRKSHKKVCDQQIVLNLDCVGDGDEIMLFPTGKLRKDQKKMAVLRHAAGTIGKKTVSIREKGFAYYPSDQANFVYGVGIAALLRSKWAGLYLDKIHTRKDTVLDEENVNILRDRLTAVIAAEERKNENETV